MEDDTVLKTTLSVWLNSLSSVGLTWHAHNREILNEPRRSRQRGKPTLRS